MLNTGTRVSVAQRVWGRSIRLSVGSRYGIAVAVAVLAVVARLTLNPVWGDRLPYITLFPAIMLSAWIGGLGPGAVATALTAIAAEYFWIEPTRSWRVGDETEFFGLGLFVVIGVFMSALNEAWHRAIDAVRASEEHLRVTMHSLGDAVIATDDRGCVTQLNPVAEGLTGWRSEDALGHALKDIFVIVNEETRQPAPNPVERVLQEGTIAALANHTVLISRTGREIPIDDSAAPVRTEDGRVVGTVMVFRDITERRQIERERAQRERVSRQLAAIVESSHDAILGTDLEGTITAWNRAAERMYGYTASEAIGKSIRLIVPAHRSAEEDGVLDKIRAGERVDHFETVRRRNDGTEFPVSLSLSPVRDADGTVIGASKIARDITQRKEIEDQRARILSREKAARTELERASRLKDEFLAVLSHELRTPLNAVRGYAQLLASGTLSSERAAHALDAIQRNAQAQARLVESLLDLSRILAGKLELDLQAVDLSQLIAAAIDVIRPEIDAKRITVDVAMTTTETAIVGDASRLQQVFWNLFSNAAKFTPPGGRIDVRVSRADSQVRIQVSDTGQGIDPKFLPYVFDRFRQEDRGGGKSPVGLGLGLAIVREMVQAHGGTVVAASDGDGCGSTFTVQLPSNLTASSRVAPAGDRDQFDKDDHSPQ